LALHTNPLAPCLWIFLTICKLFEICSHRR
jgi:hypothetical protein